MGKDSNETFISTTPSRAWDWLHSIGVNTHLSDTFSPYGQLSQVKSELDWIGVGTIRDTNPFSWSINNYASLANQGIKLDLGVTHNPGVDLSSGQFSIASEFTIIDQLEKLSPGSIIALEGLNEPWIFSNVYNGQLTTDWATVFAVQAKIYSTKGLYSDLSQIPLLSPSLDPNSFSGQPSNYTTVADIGNSHIYPYGGLQPNYFVQQGLLGQQALMPGQQAWITEFGYSDTPEDSNYGVDASVQEKNTLNGLLDAFKAGVAHTFLYQLNDETSSIAPDTPFGSLGLFNQDGSPKPVATGLHNLSQILIDNSNTASNFQATPLDISIQELPQTASSLLLEKSNGVYDLIIWNEMSNWNSSLHQEISVPNTEVKIGLLSTATINVYDPTVANTPIQLQQGPNVTVQISDHPIVIEIKQNIPIINFLDKDDHHFSTQPIISGAQTLLSQYSTLDQPVTQSIGSNGVDTISTPSWNSVKTISITDVNGGSYATNAFAEVNAVLSGSNKGSLLLTNAQHGTVSLDSGNYNVTINAHTASSDPVLNHFVITTGSGEDTVTIRGDRSYTHGDLTTGSGHTVFFGASGGNQITFGSGRAEITGGVGSDSYIYHANSGVDIIQNFDSVHDLITIDQSLKNSMKISHGAEGTTMMFGSSQHELVLHAVQNFDSGLIHWN